MPVRRRYLVIQLRRLRNAAGLTQDRVWKDLGWSRAKLQRLEAGEFQRVRAGDIMALCQLYGAEPEIAQELVRIAQESRTDKPWWLQYQDILSGAFVALEAEASTIQVFTVGLVPGLLQTPAYIAALLDASVGVDKREAERRLRVRLERQKNVLEREQPPRFTAIIDEGAVRRRVGGDEVIGDQIGYLVDMGRRPGIEIRIVPFEVGAHASGGLPFSIFGFGNPGGADSVVFQEARGDGFYLESPEEIERHRLSFERTRKSALSVEESRDYLKTLA
jgi:transcriptional regulator with XRE-family HTH domain